MILALRKSHSNYPTLGTLKLPLGKSKEADSACNTIIYILRVPHVLCRKIDLAAGAAALLTIEGH